SPLPVEESGPRPRPPLRAEPPCAVVSRDHEHVDPRCIEAPGVRVEIAALRVDDLEGKPAQTVTDSESLEDVSEIAAGMAERRCKLGLFPQRLRTHGDGVGTGTEIAHELHVGAPPRPGEVPTCYGANGIVAGTAPRPRHESVLRRDDVRVDPGPVGPGGREAQRLETRRGRGHPHAPLCTL